MNYQRAIFLISDEVRHIVATYLPEEGAKRTSFKTFDRDIGIDDYVVVPSTTRHGMTVVRVVEVDTEPDLDSEEPMEWIVGRIDRTDFEDLERQEAEAVAQIKSAQKRRKREELRQALLDDTAETAIKSLPISGKAVEPQAPPPDADLPADEENPF